MNSFQNSRPRQYGSKDNQNSRPRQVPPARRSMGYRFRQAGVSPLRRQVAQVELSPTTRLPPHQQNSRPRRQTSGEQGGYLSIELAATGSRHRRTCSSCARPSHPRRRTTTTTTGVHPITTLQDGTQTAEASPLRLGVPRRLWKTPPPTAHLWLLARLWRQPLCRRTSRHACAQRACETRPQG